MEETVTHTEGVEVGDSHSKEMPEAKAESDNDPNEMVINTGPSEAVDVHEMKDAEPEPVEEAEENRSQWHGASVLGYWMLLTEVNHPFNFQQPTTSCFAFAKGRGQYESMGAFRYCKDAKGNMVPEWLP